jgi:hypothetical protein
MLELHLSSISCEGGIRSDGCLLGGGWFSKCENVVQVQRNYGHTCKTQLQDCEVNWLLEVDLF